MSPLALLPELHLTKHLACLLLLATCLATPTVLAQDEAGPAKLAAIFGDHMVLQRDATVPVWGWGTPGESVTVTFGDLKESTDVGDDGRWAVTLPAMKASADGRTLTTTIGGQAIEINDVLVGEVWLAAGQSNMVHDAPEQDTGFYPMYESPGDASLAPIRVREFGWGASIEPLSDEDAAAPKRTHVWQEVAAKDFEKSNAARYFARSLRDELGVPVGIVQVAVPGTNQAAWMAEATLRDLKSDDHADYYAERLSDSEATMKERGGDATSFAEFAKQRQATLKAGETDLMIQNRRVGAIAFNYPAALYNTRVHPLAPFAIRGVIWHQGEAGPSGPYGERLASLARQWRELFGQDFVFIWGTLVRDTTQSVSLDPTPGWFYRSRTNKEIRQGAEAFGDDPNADYVELYDIGDHAGHFELKTEMGRRYALAALTLAYGRETSPYTGPRMTAIKLEGPTAAVTFSHVGDGLSFTPSINGISGVAVANGDDWRWANVKVVGDDRIEVTHPDGQAIERLSYASWANPHETIFNHAGLPASPFEHNVGREVWTNRAEFTPVLTVLTDDKDFGYLNLAHVRAEGYVFQLVPGRKTTAKTVKVRGYVPERWEGVSVVVGEQRNGGEMPVTSGNLSVEFEVPIDGSWVIVAREGHADAFKGVQRY